MFGARMKTLKLTVKGHVRKVGYRGIVDERAHDFGITGYVKNLEDGKTVEIVAQHSDEKILKKFIESIKITEYPVRVEKVETEEIEASPYDDFQVIEGPLDVENRESIEASVIYMRQMAGEMKATRGENRQFHKEDVQQSEKMLEKQDKMLEKQDETVKVLGSKLDRFSDSTSQRFDTMENKYGKISESMGAISKDLHELVEILKAFKPKE